MIICLADSVYQVIGRTQVMIQVSLWSYAIYMTDFVLIPLLFKDNLKMEFVVFFLYLFHQICMGRNLIKAMYTISNVRPIQLEKKDEGNMIVDDDTEKINKKEYEKCKKCEIIRPKRSHHCSICEMCIDKMDHHCYILNNCVGRYNYRFFFSYIFLTAINAFIIGVLSFYPLYTFVLQIKIDKTNPMTIKFAFIRNLFKIPIRSFILFIIAIITFIMMTYFVIYHLYILYKDQTTIERKYSQLQSKKNQHKKQKTMTQKINSMLHSDNWFDIYWPD